MKKLIVLLVLAGICFLGYKFFIAKSKAVQTYERFAEAMAYNRIDDALKEAVDEGIIEGSGDAQHRVQAGWVPVEHIHGTDYQIESESKSEDGKIEIQAKQTLFFDPPGATSALGGAMAAIFQQTATLEKTSEGWKVVEFDSELLETKDTRP